MGGRYAPSAPATAPSCSGAASPATPRAARQRPSGPPLWGASARSHPSCESTVPQALPTGQELLAENTSAARGPRERAGAQVVPLVHSPVRCGRMPVPPPPPKIWTCVLTHPAPHSSCDGSPSGRRVAPCRLVLPRHCVRFARPRVRSSLPSDSSRHARAFPPPTPPRGCPLLVRQLPRYYAQVRLPRAVRAPLGSCLDFGVHGFAAQAQRPPRSRRWTYVRALKSSTPRGRRATRL